MNLEKLINFGVAVAIVAACAGRLDQFTWQVRLATFKVLKASQTSTWGSPKFLKERR